MTKNAKLLAAIRGNPADVRFKDACKAAVIAGFKHKRTNGSHHVYARSGELTQLNFQDRDGYVKPYQVRQLLEMLDKYVPAEDESSED